MSLKIALVGNPNSGKTTLFNALTGSNQYVGNWPGVTVEKKQGKLKADKSIMLVDLPGIYSLSPYTLEEVISRNYLLQEKPDAIINIVDGTNLERNLYLTTQLTELSIPVILAINMMDVVEKNGDKINIDELSEQLGVKVLEISALRSKGINELVKEAIDLAKARIDSAPKHTFCGVVEHAIAHIEEAANGKLPSNEERWYAIKLFERDSKALENLNLSDDEIKHIEEHILEAEKAMDDDSESIITNERYIYIGQLMKMCYDKKDRHALTNSDKIDKIVTNRILALPIFVLVISLVYYISITTVGGFLTEWTNTALFEETIVPACRAFLEGVNTAPWLVGLLVDGIVAGVGAVLGFVPQILVLFILLAILEECGYMARIAFVLDRIFRKFGLSGKSFIPMLIGTGCSIPGIMASRTIENQRDRRMTIMTTSFMPCSAKLPVIALIAGALLNNEWWVGTSAYLLGILSIIVSGIMLKKTKMFSGDPAPFVMELPAYHIPTFTSVMRSMWERGWSFIKKAGTIILLSSIFIWLTSSFNWNFEMVEDYEGSILESIGSAIAWIFTPLGFGQTKAAVATFMGLVAKENVVNTFGILYGFAEVAEDGAEIWSHLQADYSAIAGYSFLVFNLLCAPCFAAIGAIKREMNNGKWTAFAILYQTLFAYAVALMVYQFGMAITGQVDPIGLTFAVVIAIAMLFQLFKPFKNK